MALFRRAKEGDVPGSGEAPARPIGPISDQDIEDAERLMDAIDLGLARASQGQEASVLLAAIKELSLRAGTLEGPVIAQLPEEQRDAEYGRTFLWLAAVAAQANIRGVGTSTLSLRIAYFTWAWTEHLHNDVSGFVEMDIRLCGFPTEALLDIYKAALIGSHLMPDELPAVDQGEKMVPVGNVRRLAAERLGGSSLPHDSLLPDTAAAMEAFGNYRFYGLRSDYGMTDLDLSLAAPILCLDDAEERKAAAGRCAGLLADELLSDGGWPVYGAYKFVDELLKSDFESPADRALLEAGLEFLRENGIPWLHLSPFEHKWWDRLRGESATWIVGRPPPSREDAVLRELGPGENRHLFDTLRPDGVINSIYARRGDDGEHSAMVSDQDGSDPWADWQRAQTLYDLYVTVGQAVQIPQHSMAEEFEPFVPMPKPQIRPPVG